MQEGEQRVQEMYIIIICDLMIVFFNEFIFSCDVSNKHIYLITQSSSYKKWNNDEK
jgi:hypothetical protein